MKHRISNPDSVATPDGHFSQATLVQASTQLLFISGQVPRNIRGDKVGIGDATAQAEQVFANLRAILAGHGATFANAVKATIFTTDAANSEAIAAVRKRFYGEAQPASTWVIVNALGDPDWLLEVELIAAI
jgi:2-iminobutanoate/2-iminopropanoate deaminase